MPSERRQWLRDATLTLAAVGASLVTACGGSEDDTRLAGGATTETPATSSTPTVLLAERVDTPETRQIYVHLLPSLPTESADRSQAYEFGSVYVYTFEGMVYIRDREAGTISRFRATDDRQLVPDTRADGTAATLSTQALGVRPFGMPMTFISATRAYLIDPYDLRIIVWDPSTMEITSTFPIADTVKAGFEPPFLRGPVRVGDRIFLGVNGWENRETLSVHPGTGVLILSATTDGPGTLIEDPRITGAGNLFADAAGDVYIIGDQYGGLYNVAGPTAGQIPPAGVLRIERGADEFDPDYLVNLNTVTGSPAIVGTFLVDETTLAAQLWEPGVEVPANIEVADDYGSAEGFVYGLIDLTGGTYSTLPSIPKGGVRSVQEVRMDGLLYVQVYVQVSDTVRDVEVHSVTPAGTQKVFTIPGGDLQNIDRVR